MIFPPAYVAAWQTGNVLERDSMLILRAAVVAKTRAHALGTSRVLAFAEEPLFPGVEALRIIEAGPRAETPRKHHAVCGCES